MSLTCALSLNARENYLHCWATAFNCEYTFSLNSATLLG